MVRIVKLDTCINRKGKDALLQRLDVTLWVELDVHVNEARGQRGATFVSHAFSDCRASVVRLKKFNLRKNSYKKVSQVKNPVIII
tara:strand:+ start:176 stop:430 length:255 start_codon:yes stop_codon:yes gene_type:complete